MGVAQMSGAGKLGTSVATGLATTKATQKAVEVGGEQLVFTKEEKSLWKSEQKAMKGDWLPSARKELSFKQEYPNIVSGGVSEAMYGVFPSLRGKDYEKAFKTQLKTEIKEDRPNISDKELKKLVNVGWKGEEVQEVKFTSGLVGAEISANVQGFISPKRGIAGFTEGTVAWETIMDRFKTVDVPLTEGKYKFTTDIAPVKFKQVPEYKPEDVLRTIETGEQKPTFTGIGRSASTTGVGAMGSVTAGLFRKGEVALQKRGYFKTAEVLGQSLDFPEEFAGDVLTPSMGSGAKTFTSAFTSGLTKTSVKPIDTSAGVFSSSVAKDTGFSNIITGKPSKKPTQGFTDLKSEVMPKTDPITDPFTDVPSPAETIFPSNVQTPVPSVTESFTTAPTTTTFTQSKAFTPKFFFPYMGSLGGGAGGGYSFSFPKSKTQVKGYTPSLTAMGLGLKGKASRGGVLSGLGMRPITASKVNFKSSSLGSVKYKPSKGLGLKTTKGLGLGMNPLKTSKGLGLPKMKPLKLKMGRY